MNKTVWIVVACLVCLATGFFAGRKTVERIVEEKVVRLPAVSGQVESLLPKKTIMPDLPLLPMKRDTIWRDSIRYVAQIVDTAAIIADYQLKRIYAETLFDNQYGKLDVSFNTQYNKSDDLRYTFVPVQTIRTVARVCVWQPFVSVSYNSFGQAGIGGGLFYHNMGVEALYLKDIRSNQSGYGVGVKWKF